MNITRRRLQRSRRRIRRVAEDTRFIANHPCPPKGTSAIDQLVYYEDALALAKVKEAFIVPGRRLHFA